eukprot:6499908-Prymnesium_polylepis.1
MATAAGRARPPPVAAHARNAGAGARTPHSARGLLRPPTLRASSPRTRASPRIRRRDATPTAGRPRARRSRAPRRSPPLPPSPLLLLPSRLALPAAACASRPQLRGRHPHGRPQLPTSPARDPRRVRAWLSQPSQPDPPQPACTQRGLLQRAGSSAASRAWLLRPRPPPLHAALLPSRPS